MTAEIISVGTELLLGNILNTNAQYLSRELADLGITVYLGAACGETVYVKKLFVSRPDRALVRARAAQAALELVLRLAQGRTPAGTKPLTVAQQHDTAVLDALDAAFLSE